MPLPLFFEKINAATLLTVAQTMDATDHQGPEALLRSLIERVKETQQCTETEACEYIAARGPLWNGGVDGAIGVRVRDDEDGSRRVQWGGLEGDYTWCGLSDVLQAIANGNLAPDWHEEEWVEVWHRDYGKAYGGYWRTREPA